MGRPKKIPEVFLTCIRCKKEYVDKSFSVSHSPLHTAHNRMPYCKECIQELYDYYFQHYLDDNIDYAEKVAIKRMCIILDLFYDDKIYLSAYKKSKKDNTSLISEYIKRTNLQPYNQKTYEDTFIADITDATISAGSLDSDSEIPESTVKFFGKGFSNSDYEFLQEQYNDWTARHECKDKSQEEIFKRLCFKQLETLKATRRGEDTKDLDFTFQKYLETAKLQPKQNYGEIASETQTFGTLLEKYEETRPLPEIDEELKDVDRIGLYIDVFFRGHLAKMMGLKNGISNLYSRFISNYTVTKPEYGDDEDSELLFDAIFGNATLEDDE